MSRTMRFVVLPVLMIAWLQTTALADPTPVDQAPYDRDDLARARATKVASTPWIDLGPNKALSDLVDRDRDRDRDRALIDAPAPTTSRRRKIAAAATLGGLYLGFSTWTYFAWYRNKQRNIDKDGNYEFRWGGDRWFEVDTYAGGADKLGHAWATLGLGRGGTELLAQWGGFSRLTASLIGCGLSEALFFAVEIKDGAYYEFSFGDLAFDTLGALLGVALSNWPKLDDLIDFRVEYFPSREYRAQVRAKNDVNIAEDYSGQTYLLAFHPGGIDRLRNTRWGSWTRFIDVAVGFETRGYKPEQIPVNADFPVHQKLFIGVTLNAQGVFDALLGGRSGGAEVWRKITHGAFEFFNLPATTLPALGGSRGTIGPDKDGA